MDYSSRLLDRERSFISAKFPNCTGSSLIELFSTAQEIIQPCHYKIGRDLNKLQQNVKSTKAIESFKPLRRYTAVSHGTNIAVSCRLGFPRDQEEQHASLFGANGGFQSM